VAVLGADDKDLAPGDQVGEYVVDGKIGAGGFGTVFKATHPVIGKQVAIKVLSRQFSAQAEMVSRFVAEARAVNQIRHRHIIDIFSFGQLDDGRHYYIMELLEGLPLDEYLDQREVLPLGEAIPILRSVARALDAAHAKGIAHRDLKPENVFLVQEEDGTLYPKLLDFGIAKLMGATPQAHKTRTGAPIGTPYYMSPEQCRGRDVDHRTDIYAFGVLAYRMLTGVLPFDGADYMEILMAQIGVQAAPPSSHMPNLPTTVDHGIAWMLKKEPAERPPNLVTAVRALEDAAEAAGISIPTGPAPSGVYAASTSSVSAQRTPSVVTPLPRSMNATPGLDMGSADTLGADTLSRQVTGPLLAPPARSRLGLIAASVAGAVVVGGVVYVAVSGLRGSAGTPAVERGGPAPPVGADAAPARVAPAEPPVAPPSAHADAAVGPALVTLTIAGAPDGAEVWLAGKLLGLAPEVQVERSEQTFVLTFKADGYRPATAKVVPDRPTTVKVTMKRKGDRVATPPGKDGRDGRDGRDGEDKRNTIEDPFGKP
jgi:serine/threonine-protein kinase